MSRESRGAKARAECSSRKPAKERRRLNARCIRSRAHGDQHRPSPLLNSPHRALYSCLLSPSATSLSPPLLRSCGSGAETRRQRGAQMKRGPDGKGLPCSRYAPSLHSSFLGHMHIKKEPLLRSEDPLTAAFAL